MKQYDFKELLIGLGIVFAVITGLFIPALIIIYIVNPEWLTKKGKTQNTGKEWTE